MLENYLVQTCEKVTTTRNAYGDYIYSTVATIQCRFRYIETVRRTANQELNDSDAMLWVAPDEDIARGDTILFEGVYYQIERINKARRLEETAVQFIKCDLKITNVAIS